MALIQISHQFFDYKITFVNSQIDNTNLKGDFVLKAGLNVCLKSSGIQK